MDYDVDNGIDCTNLHIIIYGMKCIDSGTDRSLSTIPKDVDHEFSARMRQTIVAHRDRAVDHLSSACHCHCEAHLDHAFDHLDRVIHQCLEVDCSNGMILIEGALGHNALCELLEQVWHE